MSRFLACQLLALVWSSVCERRPVATVSLLQTARHRRYFAADQEEPVQLSMDFEKQYLDEQWAQQIYGQAKRAAHGPGWVMLDIAHATQLLQPNATRIILHHIWKAGGTHLCDLARESGFVAPLNDGCHRLANDSALATDAEAKWTPCAARPGLAEVPFNLVGHECPVDESELSSAIQAGFKWVGVLRDPVEQAYSWFAHAKRSSASLKTFTDWTERCTPGSGCGFYTFQPNLQTRWLAGQECRRDPELPGCVDKALANLRKMAVVLEQRGNELLGLPRLASLGWKVEAKPSSHVSGAQIAREHSTKEEQAAVAALQRVDLALIRAARAQGII